MSGWTDERVETLKKLWADGLSASQCAGRLGFVTRNAVIGKAYRLGLPRRATTSRMCNRVPRLPLRPTQIQSRAPGRLALKPPALSIVSADAVPVPLQVAIINLKQDMCRWPISEHAPKSVDFYFCGHAKAPGVSYCEHHACRAFRPTARRRK